VGVLGVAQVPGSVKRVEARDDETGRVADVVQPGGGFQQVGVRAEGWRQAACPGGDALDVCPAAGEGVLEELCVPRISSMALSSRVALPAVRP
jgi:hypothetical protein